MAGSLTIRGVVFEHIPLEDIRAAYTNIESDLYEVTNKSHADWIPADVYSALRNGSADLYVVYKDEEYAGFLVTTLLTDFGGEKTLFIWVGYSVPKYNIISEGFEFVERLSENLNIVGIEFHSSRLGWIKTGTKHGYKAVTQVFRKEL
tara:strand:- start:198 stop:641 length:444 start_codon:yes stop_codon:yes gene_type:complete